MNLNKFKEIIEEFVLDNFNADSCRECNELAHPIISNDDKEYNNSIKKLFNDLID